MKTDVDFRESGLVLVPPCETFGHALTKKRLFDLSTLAKDFYIHKRLYIINDTDMITLLQCGRVGRVERWIHSFLCGACSPLEVDRADFRSSFQRWDPQGSDTHTAETHAGSGVLSV